MKQLSQDNNIVFVVLIENSNLYFILLFLKSEQCILHNEE